MFRHATASLLAVTAGLGGTSPLRSADLSQQTPEVVRVALGTTAGRHAFEPAALTFEAGKLYKLVLHNPSGEKHYFTALQFAAAVWTRKVETREAEIKGAVREIELKPGGSAEWYFVPVQAGRFPLECTIAGHAAAGMTGTITVR